MRQVKISKRITARDSKALELYLAEISQFPVLTAAEEEKVLREISRGNKKARETLIVSNLRFVVSVAKMYESSGVALVDLINEGNIGLTKAADMFDPTRGFKFISYAVWWIRQCILEFIINKGRMIRMPSNVYNLKRKFEKEKSAVFSEGLEISDDDIIDRLGLNDVEIRALHYSNIVEQSYDEPIGTDTQETRLSLMDSEDDPLEKIKRDDRSFYIQELISKVLKDKEIDIVKSYYGIGQVPETLEEIGMRKRITRERARQILYGAINKLKENKCKVQLREYL